MGVTRQKGRHLGPVLPCQSNVSDDAKLNQYGEMKTEHKSAERSIPLWEEQKKNRSI